MKKEFIILICSVIAITFMTIHNSNLKSIEGQKAISNNYFFFSTTLIFNSFS